MVFITAEIGINHNGSLDIVKKLIDIAVSAGCDAVKFQKRTVNKVYSKELLDSPRESPWGTTQREQKEGLEFSLAQYKIIDKYCKHKKIPWYLSCWDINSQVEMRKFKTKYNKVASAMLVHTKLLEKIAEEKKYTFISPTRSWGLGPTYQPVSNRNQDHDGDHAAKETGHEAEVVDPAAQHDDQGTIEGKRQAVHPDDAQVLP